LRRQHEIDEAIRLRREEIETGRSNRKAEELRRNDPELKRAVDSWETAYRQELAEKKVREAQEGREALERAKAGEQRRQVEEARKREEARAEQERQAVLKKYNVQASVRSVEFYTNPFRYQGQAILLHYIRFDRMLESNVGVFHDMMDREILISGLPNDLFTGPTGFMSMIVRAMGKESVTNLFGAAYQIPCAQYLALY